MATELEVVVKNKRKKKFSNDLYPFEDPCNYFIERPALMPISSHPTRLKPGLEHTTMFHIDVAAVMTDSAVIYSERALLLYCNIRFSSDIF